jgi:hypothetical protein
MVNEFLCFNVVVLLLLIYRRFTYVEHALEVRTCVGSETPLDVSQIITVQGLESVVDR